MAPFAVRPERRAGNVRLVRIDSHQFDFRLWPDEQVKIEVTPSGP